MIIANLGGTKDPEDCPCCGGSGVVQPKEYGVVEMSKNTNKNKKYCQCELSRKTVNLDGSPRYCIDCDRYVKGR